MNPSTHPQDQSFGQHPDLASSRIIGVMPAKIVFVRHGQSDSNVINGKIKKKEILDYPAGFEDIPDRETRLSPLGVTQAQKTGPWIKEQYPEGFDVIYVSDHTRARETAGHLMQSAGWEDAEIRIDPLLGERNWGHFARLNAEERDRVMQMRKRDPLNNPMENGETLIETRERSREFLNRVAREQSGKRVLVISHGEFMEAIWSGIGQMHTELHKEFFESEEGDIKNCQVVEFSSVDPTSDEYVGKLRWVRSSCPQAQIYGEWNQLVRPSLKAADLLEMVERYPHLEF